MSLIELDPLLLAIHNAIDNGGLDPATIDALKEIADAFMRLEQSLEELKEKLKFKEDQQ